MRHIQTGTLKRTALSVAIGLVLAGCAINDMHTTSDRPQSVGNNSVHQDRLDQARLAFQKGHYGIAIGFLETELAAHPSSIAALNGLGACYDQMGRADIAQRYYFRALDIDTGSSLTLGNLGISYLLQGKDKEAARILALAVARDADNSVAAANLALAQSRLANQPDDEPFTSTPPAAEAKSIQQATRDVPGISPVVTSESPAPPTVKAQITPQVRMEVSNGNGVEGMARATSGWLADAAHITHITNADRFDHETTLVLHRIGFAAQARALANQLPVESKVQPSTDLKDDVDIRLLLGRDFSAAASIDDHVLRLAGQTKQAATSQRAAALEIANGNGVEGMASRFRGYLQARGGNVVRLTNADNFGYEASVIYFKSGHRDAAEQLAKSLPVDDVAIRQSNTLINRVDVKLLLGRDMVTFDGQI